MIDHVVLGARDLGASRAFYERALAPLGTGVVLEHSLSGVGLGRDNGRPRLRPQDHRACYGAFALDPDANNVAAVCHREEA